MDLQYLAFLAGLLKMSMRTMAPCDNRSQKKAGRTAKTIDIHPYLRND